MFSALTEKLESVVSRLRGYSRLSEGNLKDSLKEVRLALLEADVNYKVVKEFLAQAEEKALGQLTLKGVLPGQQFVKIIYDQMVELLGGKLALWQPSGTPPQVIMVVGLQGSGKTTTVGKLAKHISQKGKKSYLVAADIYRPAAVEQLKILGQKLNLPVFHSTGSPVEICRQGVEEAKKQAYDVVILDTAGRLHIDEKLMLELRQIMKTVNPSEVFLVADSMTGQDAVNVAKEFNEKVGLSGIILTKMDGDTRGGAALSMHWICGKPIRFVGTGERLDALEPFYPDRLASRILGMGDVVSLVEKAQAVVEEKEAQRIQEKIQKESFTFEDFYDQLQQLKKMGPLEGVLKMIPGMGGKALKGADLDEKSLQKTEAIISSMTREERQAPKILNGSRRQRIARGSGTSVQDVNRLVKQFEMMEKMVKSFSKMNPSKISKLFSN